MYVLNPFIPTTVCHHIRMNQERGASNLPRERTKLLYMVMCITQKPTAPGVPRWSPIQVLSRPMAAWLPRSDEIGHIQPGMAVGIHCWLSWQLYRVLA